MPDSDIPQFGFRFTTPGTPPRRSCCSWGSTNGRPFTGWSNTAMAARYQHIAATIPRDVADRVGGLRWKPPETAEGSAGQPQDG